jgi:glycosyltransferase involved in cell wall biosynthesis
LEIASSAARVSSGDPRRIRVLHVLNTLQIGGAEVLVLNLAQGYDRSRFDLRVASLGEDGAIGARLRAIGVPTFALGRRPGLDPALVGKLVGLCRREAIEVVHSHNVAPWLYAGPAGRWAGAAVCHTEHSSLLPAQRALWRAERVLATLTRAVICDGDSVRRQLVDQQGLPARKVITIHNGVDLAASAPAADRLAQRRAAGIDGAGPVIGAVARLEPVKDQAMLVRAFTQVLAAEPRARLVLVGDGGQRRALQDQVAAAGIAAHVVFLGARADVAALLPLFDVFALSSLSEGLPLTILEAMAAGLPCVATAVGAVAEAIVADQTGLLVPARDAAGFAAALLTLVRDPARARQMGHAGQQRARAHFDLRVMIRRYQDLWAA